MIVALLFLANYAPFVCTPTYYRLDMLRHYNTWQIHGLWIEQCQECLACGYPSFCKNVQYNSSLLDPIKTQLAQYWYPGLLQHEWFKHGSCFPGNITEFDYFNMTLQLFYHLDINNCTKISQKECFYNITKLK